MAESVRRRRRRKFLVGLLDQLASILGGLGVSAVAAGVLAPIIAGVLGSVRAPAYVLKATESIAGSAALAAGVLAVMVKGWAKRLDDDQDQ